MKIHHPNPSPGEVSANGLTFVDGVAEVKGDLSDIRPILEEHGFRFEDKKPRSGGASASEAAAPRPQKKRAVT